MTHTRTIHRNGNLHRLTPDEAAEFLRTWFRIVDADGSTVGYAPDEQTAREFAQAPELADAIQALLDTFAPNGSYLNDVQARVVTRAICALARAHGRTE